MASPTGGSGTGAAAAATAGRRRKTAQERRQQAQRADARRFLWACKALSLVHEHRGGELGRFGSALYLALQVSQRPGEPNRPQPSQADPIVQPVDLPGFTPSREPPEELPGVHPQTFWHTIRAASTEVILRNPSPVDDYLNVAQEPLHPTSEEAQLRDADLRRGEPVPAFNIMTEEDFPQMPVGEEPAQDTPIDAVMSVSVHDASSEVKPKPNPEAYRPDVFTSKGADRYPKLGPNSRYPVRPPDGASKGTGAFLAATGTSPYTCTQGGAGSGRGSFHETYEAAFPAIQTWYDAEHWHPPPE